MPGALIHIRITWVLSPMMPRVMGVTLGSPCAHGVVGTPHGEVRDNYSPEQKIYSPALCQDHCHWKP